MIEVDLRVLKNILSDKNTALDFINSNDAKIFSSDVWNFANVVFNYIKKYQEIPTERTLKEYVEKSGNSVLLKKISETWEEVQNTQVDKNEFKFDVDKLKARCAEAEILNIKNELSSVKAGTIDVNYVINKFNKASQSIQDLYNVSVYDSKNAKEFLTYFVDSFNIKKNSPEKISGLLTGYSFLDFATNGLKPADMLLIAGESGFGKSLFLENIAIQIWQQSNNTASYDFTPGKNIIYFSLEMPYEDCFNRLIGKLSGVSIRKIENANLTKEEFLRVKDALAFIKAYPNSFRIVDMVDASANDIEAAMVQTGEKYDAVFVDYLGIMNSNQKSDEADWMKQGQISYELRHIARKYKIPLLSAVQLNRKSIKEGSDNIGLSRLARSASIATHATHVIQIESRPKEEQFPDFLYHVIKNRRGAKGKGTLNKNLSCASLIDKQIEMLDFGFTDYSADISHQLEAIGDLDMDF